MPDPMEWQLKFVDLMSAPLKAVNEQMKVFQGQLASSNKALADLEKAHRAEAAAAGEAKEIHADFFGDMLKADLVAEAITKVTEKVIELGVELGKNVIEAVDFDYRATTALEAVTGSAKVASDVMRQAQQFSMRTGASLKETADAFTQLAAVGMRGGNLTGVVAAAKDLSSAFTRMPFSEVTHLFERVAGRGLDSRGLMMLNRVPALVQDIQKQLGVSSFKGLQHYLQVNPLQPMEAIKLIENAIAHITHEGNLGEVTEKISMSFSGAWDRIKASFEVMLGRMGEMPEFEHLRSSFSKVADMFNPDSPSGKRMSIALSRLLEPLLKGIDQIASNPAVIEDFFNRAAAAATKLANVLAPISKTLGWIVQATEAWGSLTDPKEMARNQKNNISLTSSGEGTHPSLGGGYTARDLALAKHLQAQEKISSLGDYTIPRFASGGTVTKPTLALVGERPERITPIGEGGSGAGGNHSFHIEVAVQGGKGLDEQALAERLEELLPSALISAMEQANQQMGAA